MPTILQKPSEFRAQRTDKGSLEIVMYDVIGADLFGGISAREVLAVLSAHKDVPEIVVRLNSPGGSVFEGVAIYNALAKHPARVVIEVDALAASAASVIAMAGDEIRMAKGAYMMVHEAWGFTQGPAEDHEKNAELLRKLSGTIADIYEARTKVPKRKVVEMMAAETWLTADEALSQAFATSVHSHKASPIAAPQNSVFGKLVAEYKNTPIGLLAPERAAPVEALRSGVSSPSPFASLLNLTMMNEPSALSSQPKNKEERMINSGCAASDYERRALAKAMGTSVEELAAAERQWNETQGAISVDHTMKLNARTLTAPGARMGQVR